jgi:hypothetical protein
MVIGSPVNRLKRWYQKRLGANSKAGSATEQSEWVRKTSQSVEITVETDEIIVYRANTSAAADILVAARRLAFEDDENG